MLKNDSKYTLKVHYFFQMHYFYYYIDFLIRQKLFVDMSTLPSKENLVAALRSTFIGDSKTLQQTTEFLASVAENTGTSYLI